MKSQKKSSIKAIFLTAEKSWFTINTLHFYTSDRLVAEYALPILHLNKYEGEHWHWLVFIIVLCSSFDMLDGKDENFV